MDDPAWKTTESLFRDYLLSSAKAPLTVRTYLFNVWTFWRFCGRFEVTPYEADKPMIRAWTAQRQQEVSSGRAHNDLAALRHFYAWLRETKYRDDDPTVGIRVKRAKTLPTKPLTRQEVAALQDACQNERDRLIILVLAYTGMRISELSSLNTEHIDWHRGGIVIHGKGAKERVSFPNVEVINRLRAFLGMFPPPGPIWVSRWGNRLSDQQLRKIIYTVAARAKVENVHPHRFRATYGTELLEKNKDFQALQYNLGHENIQTSAGYTYWTQKQRAQEMSRALDLSVP